MSTRRVNEGKESAKNTMQEQTNIAPEDNARNSPLGHGGPPGWPASITMSIRNTIVVLTVYSIGLNSSKDEHCF